MCSVEGRDILSAGECTGAMRAGLHVAHEPGFDASLTSLTVLAKWQWQCR